MASDCLQRLLRARTLRRRDCDRSTDTAATDHVDRDAQLLQRLQDSEVGKATGTSPAKYQTHGPITDDASQSLQIWPMIPTNVVNHSHIPPVEPSCSLAGSIPI